MSNDCDVFLRQLLEHLSQRFCVLDLGLVLVPVIRNLLLVFLAKHEFPFDLFFVLDHHIRLNDGSIYACHLIQYCLFIFLGVLFELDIVKINVFSQLLCYLNVEILDFIHDHLIIFVCETLLHLQHEQTECRYFI